MDETVAEMKRGLEDGLSAAEAARRALVQVRPAEGLPAILACASGAGAAADAVASRR